METHTQSSYQLTKHPIGSLKEIWAISWPLMIGLFSGSFMVFCDRMFLAHYSVSAMNASANSAMASFLVMILPMAIAEISEVFAGRFNGEGVFANVGKSCWQMIWFSLFTAPIFLILSRILAPLLFAGTGNTIQETEYFVTLLDFAPFNVAAIALIGFFSGTGKMRVITYGMLFANLVNIFLDYFLIFGFLDIAAMGAKGAALATGISWVFQVSFYCIFFLKSENRTKFKTLSCSFDKKLFLNCLKVGTPSGLARMGELLVHTLFFRIMIQAGIETLTCITLVQSFFILNCCFTEGVAKGATAIFSNLIGAKKNAYIPQVVKAGILLHSIVALSVGIILYFGAHQFVQLVLSQSDSKFIDNSDFMHNFRIASIWMSVFFLFDGFAWVLNGLLTSFQDTKFVLYASLGFNLFANLLPMYVFIGILGFGPDVAWMLLAVYGLVTVAVYFTRLKVKHKILNNPNPVFVQNAG